MLVRPRARSSSVLTIMWLMRFLSRRICFCSPCGTSGMMYARKLVNSRTKFYTVTHILSLLRHNANWDICQLCVTVDYDFWPVVLVMQNVNITTKTGQLPLRHVTIWAVQEQMDHVTPRITVNTMPMKVGAPWGKLARSNLADNICNSQSPMAKKNPEKSVMFRV